MARRVGVHFPIPNPCGLEGMMANNNAVVSVDGRRQRGERTRLAIIEAALSLQEEGVLVPTAQQISDRAGVLIRSFFRHFEDMETLFKAVDDHLRDSYEALFLGGDREGSMEERVSRAIERRSDAFERLKNLMLGTKAQLGGMRCFDQTTHAASADFAKISSNGFLRSAIFLNQAVNRSMRLRLSKCGID